MTNLNSKWGVCVPTLFESALEISVNGIYIIQTKSDGIMKLAAFYEEHNSDISACLQKTLTIFNA
jgi:hypothetical protein